MQDLEVFKQIPGYRAILKAVLKSQIQSLVQQLAQQTGEESVLLTASLEEGTLTQLGSEFGKVFLEGHDEIKSQFLGFCLKSNEPRHKKNQHRNQIQKQTKEFQESKPRKSWSSRRKQVTLPTVARRSEPYPLSMTKVISGSTKVKSRSAKFIPGSVDQKVLDSNHSHRNQNQTIKTEATMSYAALINGGHTVLDDLQNDTHTTHITSTGQEGITEGLTPLEDLHDPSVKSEALYDNDVVTTDSSNALYTNGTYSTLINNENQSTESTITENVYEEADFEHTAKENMAGETDEIAAEQVDETEDLEQDDYDYISANEEAFDDSQENMSQCHGEQGQGQSDIETSESKEETESRICIIQNVAPPKGRSAGRKSKLRLFNQNKKPSVQKSLKERKAELENYLNLENTDRPYPCNLCPKRFKERHHLVYHLRTHSGHRPYVCTICSKSFTQSSSLNTHKKLHLKDISCDGCGQIFRKISLLQNHVCKVLDEGDIV